MTNTTREESIAATYKGWFAIEIKAMADHDPRTECRHTRECVLETRPQLGRIGQLSELLFPVKANSVFVK